MRADDSRAQDILARLSPSERDQLALAAIQVYLAEEASLPDLYHREHVRGVFRGAAPTLGRAFDRLMDITRRIRVRTIRTQPVRPGRKAPVPGRHAG